MTKFSAPQQNQLAQIGAFLRDNREKQAKSLEDVAIRTYIRPQLLNGIESGNPELLPEPIFVQGFIRRYAEALGINGIELAQQFTVDSIPSTPRPARQAAPQDSATTRITRASSTSAPPATAKTESSMFSAGSLSPQEDAFPTAASASTTSTSASTAPEITANADNSFSNSFVADDALPTVEPAASTTIDRSTSDPSTSDSNAIGQDTTFDRQTFNTPPESTSPDTFSPNTFEGTQATSDISQPDLNRPNLDQVDLGSPDAQAVDDVFASKVAAFDEQNMVEANSTSQPSTFDDDLPAAFTTASPTATPAAANVSRSTLPVGVEYGSANDSPNLKPFIIGGILVAALTAGIVVIASLLGGGDREPGVANAPEATEQPTEVDISETEPTDVAPIEPASKPAVSSAPVFVEAKAISEAWVSILADGDPTPIFEGTLQPGDTEVWEAQENISVYSGDAGALELAANGGEAEVMGEAGQPTEKIFP